ncbi:hypothetical protein, partial [Paludisphaera soli]|uniref:hypothetical protein n=1 Tax=Paludisphaera soli TaxID=2712865 RepID=UPI0013EA51EC
MGDQQGRPAGEVRLVDLQPEAVAVALVEPLERPEDPGPLADAAEGPALGVLVDEDQGGVPLPGRDVHEGGEHPLLFVGLVEAEVRRVGQRVHDQQLVARVVVDQVLDREREPGVLEVEDPRPGLVLGVVRDRDGVLDPEPLELLLDLEDVPVVGQDQSLRPDMLVEGPARPGVVPVHALDHGQVDPDLAVLRGD